MDSLAARAGRTKKNRLKKAMDTARIPPIAQRTRNEWGTRILEWMDRFKRYSAAMDRMVRLMGHLANRAITFWARVCRAAGAPAMPDRDSPCRPPRGTLCRVRWLWRFDAMNRSPMPPNRGSRARV